jgi:preprotein translocase subunit SecE
LGVRVPPALQVVVQKYLLKEHLQKEHLQKEKGRTMTESVETTEQKLGLFARIGLFYRQVLSELKKVVWPTRKQLSTYTAVVLVFVLFIIAVVSLLDLVLTKIVFWVFG